MGLAASVIPGKSNEIIVSTRSHTVSLRALNRSDHDIWLQALMDAMCMPNINNSISCTKQPVHHFRYSTGGLDIGSSKTELPYGSTNRSNTLSGKLTPLYVKTTPNASGSSVSLKTKSPGITDIVKEFSAVDIPRKNPQRNGTDRGNDNAIKDTKAEKLGKKFSKVAVSDTSIPGKFKVTSNENLKESLRRSVSVEEDINRYSENIYESLKDVNKFESNIISKQTRKFMNRVNRSDSDCLVMIAREKGSKSQSPFRSEQRIKTTDNSPLPVYERYGETFYFKRPEKQNGEAMEKLWKLKMKYNSISRQNFEKEAKSDTDLSVLRRHPGRDESKNYGALYKSTALNKKSSESYDFSNLQEIIKEKTRGPVPLPTPALRASKTTRSNSILRNFARIKPSSDKNSCELVKKNSVKKRSLSFLKKMWKRKDTKWEIDSFSSELNHLHEIRGMNSDFDNLSDFSINESSEGYDVPLPEPPPDYDHVNISDEETSKEPPELPPRYRHPRSASPSHDIPTSNKPIIEPEPPALPVKIRKLCKKNSNALDFLFYENSDPGLRYLFQEEEYVQENGKEINDKELGDMMNKLSEMNKAPLTSFHLYENGQNSFGVKRGKNEEDPDYDVPRPHISLLSTLRKQSCASDSIPATHFFSYYEDSLDVNTIRDHYEEFTMAPDSLECDPWSLSNDCEVQSESWSLSCDLHDQRKSTSENLNNDSLYQDSLNPPIGHRLNEYMHLQTGYIKLHT